MTPKVVMAYPYVSEEMIEEVVDTLHSRFVGQGPKVNQFEEEFAKKFGVTNPIALNSGTAALELAYELIGIGPGDEVITTPLTCTATNIPLVRRGAKLVFADIEKGTLNIDPNDVRRKITSKTKAIVTVDLGGIMSTREHFFFNGYDDITKDNSSRRIPLIVDAAQALGNLGGDYLCYSFQAIKHITTGDGGVLICRDSEDTEKARLWRWFGIDRDKKLANNWQPYKNRQILFDIEYPGFKYAMNDIAASMGIGGLKIYDELLEQRKQIFDIYRKAQLPLVDGSNNKYWLATLLVENRDDFCEYLNQHGIETNVMQVRNDLYKIFKPFKTDLPVMDEVDPKYICIPIHNKMSIMDATYVAKIAREFLYERTNTEYSQAV